MIIRCNKRHNNMTVAAMKTWRRTERTGTKSMTLRGWLWNWEWEVRKNDERKVEGWNGDNEETRKRLSWRKRPENLLGFNIDCCCWCWRWRWIVAAGTEVGCYCSQVKWAENKAQWNANCKYLIRTARNKKTSWAKSFSSILQTQLHL